MHALAKLVGFILDPLNLVFLLLTLGALLAPWQRGAGTAAVAAATAVVLVVSVTPLPEWLLRTLEERFPPVSYAASDLAGVVVLGGATGSAVVAAERDTYLLGEAAERLTAAAGLARRHPDLPVVVAGFSAAVRHRGFSEGEMTRRLMADLGFPPDRFAYEERSRTTYENARFTARRVAGEGPWLLVTSAFHMPRAVASFRAQGLEVVPYPVDWRAPPLDPTAWRPKASARFAWARVAIKEWVGLLAYRLLGRTDTLLPSPRPGPTVAEPRQDGFRERAAAGGTAELGG